MSNVNISDESLVSLATHLYRTTSSTKSGINPPVPKEERSHWLKLARAAASFFRYTMLEPGMKSHLAPSKDSPATLVEVVSIRFPTLVTVRLPDGSLLEAEHDTLNDWSIDFGWTSTDSNGVDHLTHIDTFNPMIGPHPITGELWRKGTQPDVFKLAHTRKQCLAENQAREPDGTHSQE